MMAMKRVVCSATAVLAVTTYMASESALAACNATVNGRPMSPQECALAIQVYGQVLPGDYLVDGNGNWVNANNPMHHGNTYTDARGTRSGTVHSRYGSGQINRDGSWSHYSNLTGDGGVGGWKEGGKDCYYAFGWSNC